MALKERALATDQNEDDSSQDEPEQRGQTVEDAGGDDEPDIDVEQHGRDVTVHQRSRGTRGERRAREREEAHQAEIGGLKTQLAELRQLLEAGQRTAVQPAPAPAPVVEKKKNDDDLDEEYLDVIRQQDELSARVSRAKTQEEVDALSLKWHKLDKKRIQLLTPKPQPAAAQTQQGPRFTAEEEALMREFEPVLNHPHAREAAKGYWLAARARAQHNKTPFNEVAAHREAMTKAGEEFGIFRSKAKAPSDASRGRFAGDRGGPTNGDNGPVSIKLTEAEKIAARAWGSDLDLPDAQIFAKYAAVLMKNKAYMASRKA